MWYLCASVSVLGVLVGLFFLIRLAYNDEDARVILLSVAGLLILIICFYYVFTHTPPWAKKPSEPQVIEETK